MVSQRTILGERSEPAPDGGGKLQSAGGGGGAAQSNVSPLSVRNRGIYYRLESTPQVLGVLALEKLDRTMKQKSVF